MRVAVRSRNVALTNQPARTSGAPAEHVRCSTGSAGPHPRPSRPASRRGTGSRAATTRRRHASTRPARSPRPPVRRAQRPRCAVTRAPAAHRSATTSGRRSGSTWLRPCDLARSPRRSTAAGGKPGARGGTPAAETGRSYLQDPSARPLLLEQRLQHADRGVERRPRRAVRRLAVPAAIGQLLAEQPVDDAVDVLAEVGAGRRDLPIDAGLQLASEKGVAVVLGRTTTPVTSRGRGRGPSPAVPPRSRGRDPGGAAATGRASWSSSRDSKPRLPTGRRPPAARAAGPPSPRWRPVRARPRPHPRAHRSGPASPASGSTSLSRAASRRRSQISLPQWNASACRHYERLRKTLPR